jgi:hypothetical protein
VDTGQELPYDVRPKVAYNTRELSTANIVHRCRKIEENDNKKPSGPCPTFVKTPICAEEEALVQIWIVYIENVKCATEQKRWK